MKRVIAVAVVLACAPAALTGSDWPQWRGPLGRGISDETGIITEWTPSTNIKWTMGAFSFAASGISSRSAAWRM